MKLIANGVNGEYLDDILKEASGKTSMVYAAVAYVNDAKLIDWSIQQKIPMHLWARIDDSIPISAAILEKFLKLSSNYRVKLINDYYHPKVLFFEGFGIYIGSANLTDRAWLKNIECGVFYYQDEANTSGLTEQIRSFLKEIDQYSTPLTPQILESIKVLEANHFTKKSDLFKEQDIVKNDYEKLIASKLSTNFKGLIQTTKSSAIERKRQNFMKDWNYAQEILHKIGEQVIVDRNRPKWISSDTPMGVQVDQFLHAYHYNLVVVGKKSMHNELHLQNQNYPQKAIDDAISWWSKLNSAPSDEDRTINDWAPTLFKLLNRTSITFWNKEDFIEVASRLHAFRVNARQTRNEILGLSADTHFNIDERAKKVASWMWDNSIESGYSIKNAIEYLLYGGNESDITERLFSLTFGEGKKVYRMGIGTYGELIGWALPDKYPPRNGRTSKALYALGFDVELYGYADGE